MNSEYESKSVKMKQLSILLLTMMFCTTMWAQKVDVKGTVVDSNGEALIGASVVVKGNTSLGLVSSFPRQTPTFFGMALSGTPFFTQESMQYATNCRSNTAEAFKKIFGAATCPAIISRGSA